LPIADGEEIVSTADDQKELWIRKEDRKWFQRHFGELDKKNQDAPRGPKGEMRDESEQKCGLIEADPNRIDLHLSYSVGLEKGPIIQRTGDTSPIMEDPEQPGRYTTDPNEQRIGSYYITEKLRKLDIRHLFVCFAVSYVLDKKTRGNNALEDCKDTFLAYFPDASDFLDAPSLDVFRLANTVADFRDQFSDFLKEVRSAKTLLKSFQKAFQEIDEAELTKYGHKEISKLYATYPDFELQLGSYLKQLSFCDAVRYNSRKFLRLLLLALCAKSHERVARDMIKKHRLGELVLMQGCGDLTMNAWNVAFVSGPSDSSDRSWTLLYPDGEPLNDRTYTCLIKWKTDSHAKKELAALATKTKGQIFLPYQIAECQFKAPSLEIGPPNRHVRRRTLRARGHEVAARIS